MRIIGMMKDLLIKINKSGLDLKLKVVLLTLASLFMLIAYFLAAFRYYVNADAGYYLGVTELIHDGLVPYRDFCLDYTPLSFYLLLIPRLLMGTYPDYSGYMLFLYLFVFIDALFLALIIKKITNSFALAWFSSVVFLVYYYYLDGTCFVLEPFSMCFGMVSLWMIVSKGSIWRCLLSGALAAMAFLCKQYGLLFAAVIGIVLLFSEECWRKKLLNCLYAILGFSIVIGLFVAFFMISGVNIKELFNALSGSDYGGQSVLLFVEGVVKEGKMFPFLLFLLCLFMGRKENKSALLWGCVIGVALASLQFFFNVFPHYYMYALPFVLLLNAFLWIILSKQKVSNLLFLLYFGLLFVSIVLPMQEVYKSTKMMARQNLREPQMQNALQLRRIAQIYDLKSVLCYWNAVPYYALCPLHPSALKKYGFSFGYDTEETYCERMQDADCFIAKKNVWEEIREMSAFCNILYNDFIMIEDEDLEEIMVFVRIRD